MDIPKEANKDIWKLGFQFDNEKDQWYHTEPDKIQQAAQIVIEAREQADMGTQAESNEGYKNWYEPGTVRRPENKQADTGTPVCSGRRPRLRKATKGTKTGMMKVFRRNPKWSGNQQTNRESPKEKTDVMLRITT